MRVGVLGPIEVLDGVRAVDPGPRKQRALLAALVLHRPRAASVDALIDLVWAGEPPPAVANSLHGYIAGLRRALEPQRAVRRPASVLVTAAPGYALRLADDDVDAARFAAAVGAAHRRLAGGDEWHIPAAPAGLTRADLAELAARLDEALGWWRGTPYADLDEADAALAERARLAELRLVAREDLALVRLELGECATVAADLEALARQHPLRERLWALWALALARAGRQAAALEALRGIRRQLADELGVEPGAAVRALEVGILRQDPALSATAPVAPPPPVSADPSTWPIVGRDAELTALTGLLAPAERGQARFAAVVGEPGVGKSRLVAELGRRAAERGFAVLGGRCSQDEGTPPFWPWAAVLRDLTAALGVDVPDEAAGLAGPAPGGAAAGAPGTPAVEAERFRISDAVARLLATASARRPLLVTLEDLHWADPSSLRLLYHLAEHLGPARVLVVVTRRRHPEPAGLLAEAGAAFGRRHALRLDLAGLDEDGVAGLATLVTGERPAPARVGALRERTEGNPFFLVELLRLSADPAEAVPAAVTDVVARRVARLPERTQEVLRTAAVIGRRQELGLLAAAAQADPDRLLDDLDPALAAGIVVEGPAAESFRFAHALVRDVVYRQQPATRRARRHAMVAAALGEDSRLAESARHWLAAGPRHAATAWHSAARAAGQARRMHGYEEAAALLTAAVAAQDRDRECAPAERYDLSMAWADACRWAGDRERQLAALDRAGRAADALGDVTRLARACVGAAEGSVWTIRDVFVVHAPAVSALRRVLRGLPAGDGDLRCRALLTLAGELHFADARPEREALAGEGLAMARRIGDPALLAWAAATAGVAIWSADNVADRARTIDDALERAGLRDPVPDDRRAEQAARTMLLTRRAVTSHESGSTGRLWHDLAEARAGAERLRMPFALLVLNSIEMPWRAMRGDAGRVDELIAEAEELTALSGLPQREIFVLASLVFVRIWQGRAAELLPPLRAMYETAPGPARPLYLLALLRSGDRDGVRSVVEAGPFWRAGTAWGLTFDLALAAHAAFVLGAAPLAAEVYQSLAPYAGRPAVVGSAGAIGPVDAYLALAAAANGERDAARRHADDATALATAWDLPVVIEWLTGLRGRAGF
ncbi:ATP-binding protein [Dactylosporangium sp. CA-092794]|uniref:ATP-binding protein n=1 Tax=Dactylosporangium sp. CA-092794 TaxID=3239929 RepID=UPI003D8BFC5C